MVVYSFDSNALIKELENDIAEFGDEKVWAYWTVMDNGQEIYFEYCPLDDPELENEPDYQSISDFDKKVSKNHPNFFRKIMKSSELLSLLKEEKDII